MSLADGSRILDRLRSMCRSFLSLEDDEKNKKRCQTDRASLEAVVSRLNAENSLKRGTAASGLAHGMLLYGPVSRI
jgi:uncharacterized protein YdaU (DUF1376 family)